MSEIDKTIEELEQEVLADLNEAEMKKDSSAAGKGAVAAEPMKKVDAEEDEVEDLGAPVVKGDEKKADAAKKVKQDGSIKSSQKGDQKADSVKEEIETDEEEVVAEAKKLKEMGHDKSEMADMPKTKAEMQDKNEIQQKGVHPPPSAPVFSLHLLICSCMFPCALRKKSLKSPHMFSVQYSGKFGEVVDVIFKQFLSNVLGTCSVENLYKTPY